LGILCVDRIREQGLDPLRGLQWQSKHIDRQIGTRQQGFPIARLRHQHLRKRRISRFGPPQCLERTALHQAALPQRRQQGDGALSTLVGQFIPTQCHLADRQVMVHLG
jgi:hypothetical protein